jgi:hypothetical protein
MRTKVLKIAALCRDAATTWAVGILAFQLFSFSAFSQTRSAVMVTNTNGVLAAPANFFAANSNLLNAAVNNTHGSGGGSGGSWPGTDGTLGTNGSGQITAAPALTTVSNNFETLPGAQALAANATNFALAAAAAASAASTNFTAGQFAARAGWWPATIFVSVNGTDTNEGTNELSPLLTFSNAVALRKTLPGAAVIQLGAGHFICASNTVLPGNTCVAGAGAWSTFLDFPATIWNESQFLIAEGDNITLMNFTLGTNNGTSVYYFPLEPLAGTNFCASGLTVNGNTDDVYAKALHQMTNLFTGQFLNCTFNSGWDCAGFQAIPGPATNSFVSFVNDTFNIAFNPNFGTTEARGVSADLMNYFVQDCVFNFQDPSDSASTFIGIWIINNVTNGCATVVSVEGNSFNFQLPSDDTEFYTQIDTGNPAVLNVIGNINPALVSNLGGGGTVNYDSAQFQSVTAGSFTGNGAGVTNLNATNLPANLQVLNTNNAASLTNIQAGQLTGSVPAATLPASLQALNTNNGANLTNLYSFLALVQSNGPMTLTADSAWHDFTGFGIRTNIGAGLTLTSGGAVCAVTCNRGGVLTVSGLQEAINISTYSTIYVEADQNVPGGAGQSFLIFPCIPSATSAITVSSGSYSMPVKSGDTVTIRYNSTGPVSLYQQIPFTFLLQ